MRTVRTADSYATVLTGEDIERFKRILTVLRNRTQLEELGRYLDMSDEEPWLALVSQMCVGGGVAQWERLQRDNEQFSSVLTMPEAWHYRGRSK